MRTDTDSTTTDHAQPGAVRAIVRMPEPAPAAGTRAAVQVPPRREPPSLMDTIQRAALTGGGVYRLPSGGPARSASPLVAAPPATLIATGFTRTATNRRQLRLRIKTGARATIVVELTRDGHSLGQIQVGPVDEGSRTVLVPLGRGHVAGTAQLMVRVRDASGASTSFTRPVVVPARLLS